MSSTFSLRRSRRRRGALAGVLVVGSLMGSFAGCGSDPASLAQGQRVEVRLTGMQAWDAADELRLWVHAVDGTAVDVGRLLPSDLAGGTLVMAFELPVASPARVSVTLEPPGDSDAGPSSFILMAGDIAGQSATLTIEGAVTDGRPLQPEPGSHSLFTTSNNVAFGYPSNEDAGLWLFTLLPSRNVHETREVKVTPLERTWIYEGWAVYRYGTTDAVWVSYGKFRPDPFSLLTSRDDTGSGPFSGDEDFRNGGVEDVPGEEWVTDTIAALQGVSLPGGLVAPLDLDATDPTTGAALWTHVITAEPAFDEGEPMLRGRPFLIRPYRNPIGEGGPGTPRLIEFHPEDVPAGTLRVVGG